MNFSFVLKRLYFLLLNFLLIICLTSPAFSAICDVTESGYLRCVLEPVTVRYPLDKASCSSRLMFWREKYIYSIGSMSKTTQRNGLYHFAVASFDMKKFEKAFQDLQSQAVVYITSRSLTKEYYERQHNGKLALMTNTDYSNTEQNSLMIKHDKKRSLFTFVMTQSLPVYDAFGNEESAMKECTQAVLTLNDAQFTQ